MKRTFFCILCFLILLLSFSPLNICAVDDDGYNSEDLSDYFGTMKACTHDKSENDCRNGNEYKFYLKMYDMYYLYKNKYSVTLDLPLIMATLYYGHEELPTVFKNNLNNYDRSSVKDTSQVTNLDWEYDYKNDSCYTYLNANDSSYDMQILAKNMVKKTTTYKCKENNKQIDKEYKVENVETSNYSKEKLKCDKGEYDSDSIDEKYEKDDEQYKKFLLEYIKLKYHTKGTEVKSCSSSLQSGDNGSAFTTVTKTGQEAIDKMNEIALKQVGKTGDTYEKWFGSYTEWCAIFVSWLFNQVGGLNKYIVSNAIAGEVPRAAAAKGLGTWYEDECTDPSTVPKAGDLILYDPWIGNVTVPYPQNGNDKFYSSHIGYVVKVDSKNVYSVEGNGSKGGYNGVWDHTHDRKYCGSGTTQGINGYFRPNY